MHSIQLGKIERSFPENIFELTTEQYHYYVQLYLMLFKAHINLDEMRGLLVYHFLGLNFTGKSSPEKDANLGRLIELTEGFYEQVPGGNKIRPVVFCPMNLAREFKVKGKKFTGPADALADSNLSQFLNGITLLNSFTNNPQETKYLVKLFAEYHKVQSFRKPREVTEAEAAALPDYVLYGFYFFFQSAVEYLTEHEIELDDGRKYDFSPVFHSSSKNQGVGPVAVLFELASSGVFGDKDKTSKVNLIEALIYLLKNDQEIKRNKSRDKSG